MSASWDSAAGVVTPEAVPLQFQEANVGSRGIAYFLDALLLGAALGALNVTLGFLFADNTALPEWVVITTLTIVNFVVYFGYSILFETVWHGRTPGKAAMGLRVVTVEGAPVRFRHAAIRAVLGLIDFGLMGVPAIITPLLTRRHQRLGDIVAGTVVLRERTAAEAPTASRFRVPAGAEEYAATIDPSGLSAGDYEAVRAFLNRAYALRDEARDDLARRLAGAVATTLHHTPPSSVSAELFLMCVAARYQARAQHEVPSAFPDAQPAAEVTTVASAGENAPPTERWRDFAPPE